MIEFKLSAEVEVILNDDYEVIKLDYNPREPQKAIHKAVKNNRFSVVVAHRRMGKTVSAINQLIYSALKCEKPNPRFAYISPTYNQSKRIAWDYLKEYTRPLDATANIAELRVDFHGRRINLYGADNPDSLRGIYLDGVVIDEIGDVNPSLFSEVIRPAIADRLGWCMFIGTPKGQNFFYTLRNKAAAGEEGWKLLEFRADETNLILESELKAALREMGQEKYEQEFLCSFQAPVEGAYYAKQINELELTNRFIDIPKDDIARTFCAWDLGMGDSTAIWVCQVVNKEIRLIDFMEHHGEGLSFYVDWLRHKGYETAEHLLPHDVEVRELGSGKSRREMLEEAGLRITVVPKLSVDDGIQAVRRILPRCWFDPKTDKGINALRNYRRDYNEKRDVFYDRPLHDWSSHAADAFRYLAVGLDEGNEEWAKPLNVNYSWVV